MAMTHDKPAADIIDLNATRAEAENETGPKAIEASASQLSVDDNAEQPAEPVGIELAMANLRVGQILANAREATELSLADIVAATKIKQAHLEAIEASNNAALPAIPFTAGFIKVYANHLELDSDALVKQFKDEVAVGTGAMPDAPVPAAPELTAPMSSTSYRGGDTTRWASVVGIAAIALFALWVMMQVFSGPTDGTKTISTPRVVEAAPTVTLAAAEPPAPFAEAPVSEEMTTADVFAQESAELVSVASLNEEIPAAEQAATEPAEVEPAIVEAVEDTITPDEVVEEEAAVEQPLVDVDTAELAIVAPEVEAVEASSLTDIEIAMASQAEALSARAGDALAAPPVETAPELADAINIASIAGAPSIIVDAPVEDPSLPVTEFFEAEGANDFLIASVGTQAVSDRDPIVTTGDLNAAQADLIAAPPVQEISAPPLVRQSAPKPKIVNATVSKQASPAYPARCHSRAASNETVVIGMDVQIDGRPANVRVQSSTNVCFDRTAIAAAQRLRFTPRTVNGTQQVEAGKTVTFNFPK